jgi:hypothetical protein
LLLVVCCFLFSLFMISDHLSLMLIVTPKLPVLLSFAHFSLRPANSFRTPRFKSAQTPHIFVSQSRNANTRKICDTDDS